MMAREKFAARRATTTLNVLHKYSGRGEPDTICASFSTLPSGRIGEIWINSINGKAKLVTPDIQGACIILSKDLQNGDTLEYLSGSLPRGSWMRSVADALKKEPADA